MNTFLKTIKRQKSTKWLIIINSKIVKFKWVGLSMSAYLENKENHLMIVLFILIFF